MSECIASQVNEANDSCHFKWHLGLWKGVRMREWESKSKEYMKWRTLHKKCLTFHSSHYKSTGNAQLCPFLINSSGTERILNVAPGIGRGNGSDSSIVNSINRQQQTNKRINFSIPFNVQSKSLFKPWPTALQLTL